MIDASFNSPMIARQVKEIENKLDRSYRQSTEQTKRYVGKRYLKSHINEVETYWYN